MFSIIAEHPLPFVLALLIGLVTAWWVWGRVETSDADTSDIEPTNAENSSERAANTFTPDADVEPDAEPDPDFDDEPKVLTASAAGTGVAGGAAVLAVSEDNAPTEIKPDSKPNIAPADGEPDDLTRIKGIGPKLNELCQSLGVRRFDQIAEWHASDIAEVDQYMKIKGRIVRDEWVAQAKLLAEGKVTEHRAHYGTK